MTIEQYVASVGTYLIGKANESLLESMLVDKEKRPYDADIGHAPKEMRGLIGKDHPLGVSKELLAEALCIAYPHERPQDKAKAIYEWMVANIKYDRSADRAGYRSARETYEGNVGVCGEMAYLYIAMARTAGLECHYVDVSRTVWGGGNHACVEVRIRGRSFLVDPAMEKDGFDVRHPACSRKSDLAMASEYFCLNGREQPAWLNMAFHEQSHEEFGDYHRGISCRRQVEMECHPTRWEMPRPDHQYMSVMPVFALIAALSIGGYGVYKGGPAFCRWFAGQELHPMKHQPAMMISKPQADAAKSRPKISKTKEKRAVKPGMAPAKTQHRMRRAARKI